MRILVACEESQAVTIELRRLGHEAYSCDIVPCSGGHPEWHIQDDALHYIDGSGTPNLTMFTLSQSGEIIEIPEKWDMLIAFPPCTYLSNAGACRLYPRKGQLDMERYQKGMEAKAFFLKFLNADCPRIAVENPVSSSVFQMPKHTQEIQPYQFNDDSKQPYTKKTRLWLRGLQPLVPTTPDCKPVGPYVPAGTGRKNREKYGAAKRGDDAKNRAKAFPGIARAMAEQWAGPAEAALKGGEG